MANNVAATAGTGTTFKTTDNAGVHTGHVNVDTLPALVAGSAAIGKLAANSGVDIGDVDVLTVPADPFGVNADAASLTTSISAKLKGIATALGITALDLGTGTGGSRTLRFFKDTAQWIGGAGNVTSAVQRMTLAADDPAAAVLGTTSDAASATTTVSAKLRGIATALGVTAFDLGAGTGGTRTLRVALDTAQLEGAEYETVAASQTAQVLGASGATGDFISKVLVVPATTSPGNVLLLDNATSITIFTGGASSVSNLVPFPIDLGMISVSGAWKITTGSNVSVVAVGNFT